MDVLQWLVEQGCELDTKACLAVASEEDHGEVVAWLEGAGEA